MHQAENTDVAVVHRYVLCKPVSVQEMYRLCKSDSKATVGLDLHQRSSSDTLEHMCAHQRQVGSGLWCSAEVTC